MDVPWLQFDPIQAPPLPRERGQFGKQMGQMGAQLLQQRMGPGINPPARKFPAPSAQQRARSAGAAANQEAGPPPPVPQFGLGPPLHHLNPELPAPRLPAAPADMMYRHSEDLPARLPRRFPNAQQQLQLDEMR